MKHISAQVYHKLKSSITAKDLTAVKKLIDNFSNNDDFIDPNGNSLLNTALDFFDEFIFRLLLFSKADINYRNQDGYTALTMALLDDNLCATTLLLRAGARLDENHPKDQAAKSYAIRIDPSIKIILTQAAQGELSPLHPLEDVVELDTPIQPVEVATPHITISEQKKSLDTSTACFDFPTAKPMFSWRTINGALKHRFKPDPLSSIEMSSNPRNPSQPPPNNHPHAD